MYYSVLIGMGLSSEMVLIVSIARCGNLLIGYDLQRSERRIVHFVNSGLHKIVQNYLMKTPETGYNYKKPCGRPESCFFILKIVR